MNMQEALDELSNATDELKAASRAVAEARSREIGCVNRINSAQKKVDGLVAALKAQSPGGSDWARQRQADRRCTVDVSGGWRTSTPATENLAALLDRLTDNLNILAAAVKRDDEVIRRLYTERDALQADKRRMEWLEAKADEGCVTMCFGLDGGVHVTLDPLGGEQTAARNVASLREGIDSLMQHAAMKGDKP